MHELLQYRKSASKANMPQIQGTPIYIHKSSRGYYGLPPKLKCKLPVKDFSDLYTDQTDSSTKILTVTKSYMENAAFISSLIRVWTLEEKESRRSTLCKLVARNNGPDCVQLLLDHVQGMATDKDQWKQKASAGILCGILAGTKLWDDAILENFWNSRLMPILNSCLDSVTQETLDFWTRTIIQPTVRVLQIFGVS